MAKTVIVSDDARLAAQLSSLLMTPGTYLPVLDGPRLGRPDQLAEIVRRNNVIARVQPTEVLLAGLSDEAYEAIHQQLAGTSVQLRRVVTSQDVSDSRGGNRTPLVWGAKYIGIGLLCALRQKRMITFSDVPSPDTFVKPKWGHLVVCEEGEELSEVIAANYAYALRAGLAIIPKVAREVAESISEALYSVDTAGRPRGDALRDIREQIRSLCDTLRLEEVNSITFISREIPFGLGLSEKPSTHLFTYPDLGIAVVNGLSAERQSNRHRRNHRPWHPSCPRNRSCHRTARPPRCLRSRLLRRQRNCSRCLGSNQTISLRPTADRHPLWRCARIPLDVPI